jgi:hypothetical protein
MLTVTWVAPVGVVPAEVVKYILVIYCTNAAGGGVVPWVDNPTLPNAVVVDRSAGSITGHYSATGLAQCKANVAGLNATNVKVWWAVRDEPVVVSGAISYAWNTISVSLVAAASNGQGGGDYVWYPGTSTPDNDGDGIPNTTDPCPNTAASTCTP